MTLNFFIRARRAPTRSSLQICLLSAPFPPKSNEFLLSLPFTEHSWYQHTKPTTKLALNTGATRSHFLVEGRCRNPNTFTWRNHLYQRNKCKWPGEPRWAKKPANASARENPQVRRAPPGPAHAHYHNAEVALARKANNSFRKEQDVIIQRFRKGVAGRQLYRVKRQAQNDLLLLLQSQTVSGTQLA